ncbi:hypothetical protein CROQUDRAFT_659763 [Cronartium quercuum f. sp. fusiforme G11]|uniref:CxC1-like cysteine cluster associated with KDZ transposases domain-containing protein n=1 Tax=Cronartium quercuum f. sp. fusiforme G11 TaxID=708437 RepID=A0A9P6NFD9_9BASI|nr:hypothetical protein CROQUDRAFT_659763 [Cronartium quercuum f. sp. fusiforme G11]
MHELDLIDMQGQRSKYNINFCTCMPQAVQLIHYGHFTGSPSLPRTAFSIPLVQFHHDLWLTSSISIQGFLDGLTQFLTRHSPQQHRHECKSDCQDLC